MDVNEYIKEIEKLNLEYIRLKNGRIYKLGSRFVRIKNHDVKMLVKSAKSRKAFQQIKQNFVDCNLPEEMQKELARTGNPDKRTVVYTCVTGNYDNVAIPYMYPDNITYVLFCDQEGPEGWIKRRIPKEVSKKYSNPLINRYIKFHPFELFEGDYDYAIYMDGNIAPVSDLSVLPELISEEVGIAFHSHCTRNCIYEEMKACNALGKGNIEKLELQVKAYREEGMPSGYGMAEGNFIVTDLRNERAKELYRQGWQEFLKRDSGRDQMVWPYLFWKNGIEMDQVLRLGKNIYLDPKVRINDHN
jgi:hypothetical protein